MRFLLANQIIYEFYASLLLWGISETVLRLTVYDQCLNNKTTSLEFRRRTELISVAHTAGLFKKIGPFFKS